MRRSRPMGARIMLFPSQNLPSSGMLFVAVVAFLIVFIYGSFTFFILGPEMVKSGAWLSEEAAQVQAREEQEQASRRYPSSAAAARRALVEGHDEKSRHVEKSSHIKNAHQVQTSSDDPDAGEGHGEEGNSREGTSRNSSTSSPSASWLGGLFGTSQKFDLKDYGLGSWLGGRTKSGDESGDSGDESGESATDTKGSKHNANHHDHADAKSPDAEKSKTSPNTQKQKTSEARNSDPKSGAESDSKSASSPLSTSKLSDASWGVLNFSSEGREEEGKEEEGKDETSAEGNKDQKKRPEKVKSAEKQKSDEIEMLNSMAMSVVEDDEVGMKKVETKEKELKKDKQKIEKAAGHGDEGFLGVFGLSEDLGRSIGKGGLVVREDGGEGRGEKGKHVFAASGEEQNGEKSGSGSKSSKTIPSGEHTIHGEHISSHPDGKNVKTKSDESKGSLVGDLLGTIGLSDTETVDTAREKGDHVVDAVDAASALPHDTPDHRHKPAEKHSAGDAAAHEDPHNAHDTLSAERPDNVEKKNPPSTWWRTVTGDFSNGSDLDEKFTEYTDEKIARKSMDQLNNVAQSHTPLDKEAIENGETDEFIDDAEIERPKQLIEEAKEAAQRKDAMMKGTGKNKKRSGGSGIHHHHEQQRSGAGSGGARGSGGGKKASWFGNMFDQEGHGVGKDLEEASHHHESPAKDDVPNVAKRKEAHSNNKKTSSAENSKNEHTGSSWMSHPLSIIGFSDQNNQAAFETSSSLKEKDEKIDEALFGEQSSDNVNMSNFTGETEEKLVIKIPAVDLTPISDGFFKFISKDQYESIYHSYCFYGGINIMIFFHLFFIGNVISFWNAIMTDPGLVPPNWGFYMGDETKRRRYCKMCNVWKPDRTHHCSICKRCILNMDHHCPWINNCVGFYNRKFFMQFVIYVWLCLMVVMIASFPIVFDKILLYVEASRDGDELLEVLRWQHAFIIVGWILSILLGCTLTNFMRFHVKLISENYTTIENIEREEFQKSKYDIGVRRNWEQVFGPNPGYWWIPFHTNQSRPVGDGVRWRVHYTRLIDEEDDVPDNRRLMR